MPKFTETVSVYQAPISKKVIIKADPDGKFSNDNADALLVAMLGAAKKLGVPANVYTPAAHVDRTDLSPVIMFKTGREPYVAMFPEDGAPASGYTKLA